MHRWLHRHSRISRSLLILAMLAWTALPFDAFAHSLAMAGGRVAHSPLAMHAGAASHCDGMSMDSARQTSHASHPAPSHPGHNGHGCCTGHGCYCASLFSGIAGVPHLGLTWEPTHGLVLIPVQVAPALSHAAPPLRPPIT
jgi:hypothetical protein